MCELTMKKDSAKSFGYKVIAIDKKTRKRYSIAMGFCYDDHERIPNVKVQNGISDYFYKNILEDSEGAYSPNMIGRTALFEYVSDAMNLYSEIKRWFDPEYWTEPKVQFYRLAIMYCHIEEDIMSGHYGNKRVVAGRKLTFLREATTD